MSQDALPHVLESFYQDTAIGQFRLDVNVIDAEAFSISIYDPSGNIVSTELHPGKTRTFMEAYAQNRLSRIGNLNG